MNQNIYVIETKLWKKRTALLKPKTLLANILIPCIRGTKPQIRKSKGHYLPLMQIVTVPAVGSLPFGSSITIYLLLPYVPVGGYHSLSLFLQGGLLMERLGC